VRRAIDIAGDMFDRFTFDLIYALPDQSLSDWEREFRAAIPLMRGHLSAYQLTIKEGTAFEKQLQRGNLRPHDEDSIAAFFNLTYDMMAAAGMPAYEISNFGASGHESRHNQIYWHYNDYIGIGAGAHGRISYDGQKFATEDYKRPAEWMEAVGQRGHGAKPHTPISPQERLTEALMGALRMKKRFDLHALLARCGLPPQDWERYISKGRLDVLSKQGWLTYDNDQASITPNREGWLRTDSILPFILK
jgi:oxygen-independent coproporphyrinogen-3 oxidase